MCDSGFADAVPNGNLLPGVFYHGADLCGRIGVFNAVDANFVLARPVLRCRLDVGGCMCPGLRVHHARLAAGVLAGHLLRSRLDDRHCVPDRFSL